jgi:hypothetical protein
MVEVDVRENAPRGWFRGVQAMPMIPVKSDRELIQDLSGYILVWMRVTGVSVPTCLRLCT